jgi:short-subunit dehydrogenase
MTGYVVPRRTRGLAGRVVIVTGASSGIGAAAAHELGRRGATVVLAARRADALAAHAQAIRDAGGSAMAIPTDVTKRSHVTRLAQITLARLGRVDVLVNNAGVSWSKSLADTSATELVALVEVNLLGAMLLTRAVLPSMLERGYGRIVSVASLSGRVAMEPLYSATKYGLRGFSLALRRQLAGTGVTASLVSPGRIDTAMNSHVSARMPMPDLVGRTIAELAVHPRREVVVPRRHYAVAWLEQLAPSGADLAYRWRHWSPIREGATTWRS